MKRLALGLMSGTSADSVSAALVEFHGREFKILGHLDESYPHEIQEKILNGHDLSARDVSRLNVQIGIQFGHAAHRLLKKLNISSKKSVVIGSHGQTIYHGPGDKPANTLQIGDPAAIAEATGCPVVSNFRMRDLAAGGQGAPLIPYFDQYFFGQGPVRAMQNIGGIANVAVVGKKVKSPIAFDNGPGNTLMDRAMRLISDGKKHYDAGGQMAASGNVINAAIDKMLTAPFFQKHPPRSTGPEEFGDEFLLQALGSKLRGQPADVMATLNYFTALTIQESYRQFLFKKHPIQEIIVSGGGARNRTLVKKLGCLFAPIPVLTIDKLGIPVQAKEPTAFAFFGLRAFLGQSNHLPETTGAKAERILGTITPA